MQCVRFVRTGKAAGHSDPKFASCSEKSAAMDVGVKSKQVLCPALPPDAFPLLHACSAISNPCATYAATWLFEIGVPAKRYDVPRTHSQFATLHPAGLSAMNVSNRPAVPPFA